VVTFPISALGAEGEVLSRQLARFMAENPGIEVVKRITPDAADQKHQLYVQWLNAGASDPDIVQLDVIWTPEFAAAGWILPLDQFNPDTAAFFPTTIQANQWKDSLYALPWFIDVGMLYWRTDLMDAPPETYADLVRVSQGTIRAGDTRYGYVWQGARYEGLVANFVEYLGAHGGTILEMKDEDLEFAFNLNVKAMVRTIRAVLPGMIERGGGSIINMSSVASSVKGVPNRFAYGTTKAAVIGLTKAVAADYVAQGIRCNAICPGTVESPSLQERLRATGDYEAARAAFIARQPMGRLGTPEEIADLAVYLATATYTSGQACNIDGGWTI
jgi:NAD(P)-dependent dehydrogenase (short-subunit alcohol dehydrogenase family)